MPFNVLIAGAGPAGLEAALAAPRARGRPGRTTLLAPDDELTLPAAQRRRPVLARDHPALSARRDRPRSRRRAGRRPPRLRRSRCACRAHRRRPRAGLRRAARRAGREAVPALDRATTFWGPGDAEAVHGLVQDVEAGYVASGRVRRPAGHHLEPPALRARAAHGRARVRLGTHARAARDHAGGVAALGLRHAGLPVAVELLEVVGIHLHAGAYAEPAGFGALELRPSGQRIEVDRIVALPRLEGRPVDGLPADANGFIPVDEYARVRGLDDVWAAGDATDFPLKQGGIATQQADVAARAIAARAGAPVGSSPSARSCGASC